MASITFQSGTVVPKEWLQDVNTVAYKFFGDGTNLFSTTTPTISAPLIFKSGSNTLTILYSVVPDTWNFSANLASIYKIGALKIAPALLWDVDNIADIGSSVSSRPRTGYFGTSVITPVIDSGSTGSLLFRTNNGTTQFEVSHTAGTDWIKASSGSGSGVLLTTGASANVQMTLATKGASGFLFSSNNGSDSQFGILNTTGSTRWITITGSVAGNPTINTTAGSINLGTNTIVTGNLNITGTLTAGTLSGTLTAGTNCVQNPFAVNTKTTQAHGLGVTPHHVEVYIECLTAEQGYSIGDRIQPPFGVDATAGRGFVVEYDSTNVNILSNANGILTVNKTTPAGNVGLTSANWKVVVVPYKLN